MFKDITPDKWYYKFMQRIVRMKATNGYPDGTFKPENPVTRVETLALIDKYRQRESELIKALLFSVVTIKGKRKDGTGALGSGVILDKNGYIATNCHVAMDGLDPWDSIKVYLDGMLVGFDAKVVYGDFSQDIAIIKIKADTSLLNPVVFAEKVALLDELYCIGNPLGYTDTATKGVVSCFKRKIGTTEWIQTDAAINPGNSGGGAFNYLGELIGLPTWVILWADKAKTIPINNTGFIAPYYKVQEIYQKTLAGQVTFEGKPVDFLI
ncbi:MAG: trypsin-like peptidase domain-containing protein [Clostridia bacterium]|nr:trypsin-like peptidase domain-containing protein [Clostridia bacterium]